jgi:hypothetical protein
MPWAHWGSIRRVRLRGVCGAMLLLPWAAAAQAQDNGAQDNGAQDGGGQIAARQFTEADIAAVAMPALEFTETPDDAANYEKYFYFHRAATSFAEAYADITECDALASGISAYVGSAEPYPGYYGTQYGIGGVIGGVVGAALADAIHGSALRRKIRRINMRNCMSFKGYQRYGLAKPLWETFNFEEGNGRKRDDVREAALLKQARVASGPVPASRVIEP